MLSYPFQTFKEEVTNMSRYIFITFLSVLHCTIATDNIIHTPSGSIRGIAKQYGVNTVFQFRNIPYASPPIGDKRFQKPTPYGPWSGIRDGTVFGPSCMQNMSIFVDNYSLENANISEDCLSLNVYVPYHLPAASQRNKTVMIWVHGGGFTLGQAELYDASLLALTGDVVIVTINYRLGVFGFLSTGDDASLGNFGLWDQHLSIKWVHDNIASFGGNPQSVTIFGQSAGGWSVSFQSIATQNKGLFQRVIVQSGVSNSFEAITKNQLENAKQLGSKLGCVNSTQQINTRALLSCVRLKTSDEVLQAQMSMEAEQIDTGVFEISFLPVVDGDLITDLPKHIIQNGNSEAYNFFKSLDFVIGTCSAEGASALEFIYTEAKTLHFNATIGVPSIVLCNHIGPAIVKRLYPDTLLNKYASNAVCNKYKSSDPAEQGRKIVDVVGDVTFVVATIEALDAHSKNNSLTKTFQYLFNRQYKHPGNLPEWLTGSTHAAELPFLFDMNSALPYNDEVLAEKLRKYWTNFAKTGYVEYLREIINIHIHLHTHKFIRGGAVTTFLTHLSYIFFTLCILL